MYRKGHPMQFFAGTSAYSVKEWKGSFYPEKLPAKDMLSYYSQRFPSVEINSSYHKLPTEATVQSWAEQVPESFRFVIKAPQTITHIKRLKNVDEVTDLLLKTVSVLDRRLGPLYFQLPPNFKKDLPRLEAFLDFIGSRAQTVFEFRHASWFDEDVFDCLRAHACALCVADADDLPSIDLIQTADWGYVRLRREAYSDELLKDWIERLRSKEWETAYVFFKHEETGTGPKLATRFLELALRNP
jgi:uncharacterized protein YecE (DUF72 family)